MKILYLIRGLPGSGKSNLAHEIAKFVCEADDYFITNEGYKFDREKLREAHLYCQGLTRSLMEKGLGPIAVSNTGIRRWESQIYRNFAEAFGYTLFEIKALGNFRNTHGVPQEKIEEMRKNWED